MTQITLSLKTFLLISFGAVSLGNPGPKDDFEIVEVNHDPCRPLRECAPILEMVRAYGSGKLPADINKTKLRMKLRSFVCGKLRM